jgi:phosphocarrier protein HPr
LINEGENTLADPLIRVAGRWGLNGHESARLAATASRFSSDIVCVANGRSVNGKDVMSVMSLRARQGAQVRILAAGPDEIAALQALSASSAPRKPGHPDAG